MQENQFPDKEKISHQEHSWETDCMAKWMGPDTKETKIAEQHEMNSKYLNCNIHPLRKWGFNEKAIKTNDKYFLHLSPVTLHCSPCRPWLKLPVFMELWFTTQIVQGWCLPSLCLSICVHGYTTFKPLQCLQQASSQVRSQGPAHQINPWFTSFHKGPKCNHCFKNSSA